MSPRHTQQTSSRATDRPRESTQVQSVERAASLLRAVAAASGPSATATALAQAVGLNRTTTWRILATLEQQRLVSLDRATGWYSLGFGLIDLAGQAGGESMARTAHAVLGRIAGQTGETAALALLRDGALTYVAEADAGAIVSVTWQGRPVSLHATSTGKVLLAFSEPDEVRDLLASQGSGRLSGSPRRRSRRGPRSRRSSRRPVSAGSPCAAASSRTRHGVCPRPCSTSPAAQSRSSASGDLPSGSPPSASTASVQWRSQAPRSSLVVNPRELRPRAHGDARCAVSV